MQDTETEEMTVSKTFLMKISDLGNNEIKKVVVPNRDPLSVVRVGESFYVIDDFCSHGMASLAEGELDGTRIECPWHSGAFDVRTGEALERPCTIPIRTYSPLVEGDDIFVMLTDPSRANIALA